MINFQQSGSAEFSTAAIGDFRLWLKNNALQNNESAAELKRILSETGFLVAGEASTVSQTVNYIGRMLDSFITNPVKYKTEQPSNLNMLTGLLEACAK